MRNVLSDMTRRNAAEWTHRRHKGLTRRDSLGVGPAVSALAGERDTTAGHRKGDCPPVTPVLSRDFSGAERPMLDWILNASEISIAEAHARDFGYDPRPVDGLYTTQA